MQVSGRAARVLSYLLADNQQCKQALLGQEAQETAQRVDGSISQAGLLPFVANGICALCSNIADISCGMAHDCIDLSAKDPEEQHLRGALHTRIISLQTIQETNRCSRRHMPGNVLAEVRQKHEDVDRSEAVSVGSATA